MTRTITTAAELDALPVKVVLLDEGGWPVWRDPHTGWCAPNGTQGIPADLLIADGAPLTVLHDPSAPAPAPSVVPEAAVERAARAMQAENAPKPDPLNRDQREEQDDATIATYRTLARTALTAALPFLTAAPSATREATEDEVTEVVTEALTDAYRAERGMSRHTGLTAHDESVIRDQAAHVVSLADARFTITPKEDR